MFEYSLTKALLVFCGFAAVSLLLATALISGERAKDLAGRFVHSDRAKLAGVIGGVLGFATLILTMAQISIDLGDRVAERELRQLEMTERYRRILVDQETSDSERTNALAKLIKLGNRFEGVVISCETMGIWDRRTKTCNRMPRIFRLELVGEEQRERFRLPDMAGVVLYKFGARDIGLEFNLRESILSQSLFEDMTWGGTIEKATISFNRFVNVSVSNYARTIRTRAARMEFAYNEVSGSSISWLKEMDTAGLAKLFAWANNPPLDRAAESKLYEPNEAVVSKIVLCRPPEDFERLSEPTLDRLVRDILFNLEDDPKAACDVMTLDQAKLAFPEAYKPRRVFWKGSTRKMHTLGTESGT